MEFAPLRVDTERLVLRQFTVADHPAYARLMADPEVTQFLGTGAAIPPEVAWRSLSGMLGHWQMLGYGIWGVERKQDGALVGQAGFIDAPGWPGFELAYMLGKAYWGNGYAREAAAAALRVAREELKRDRVISLIRPLNTASIRLAQALGAQREGSVELLGSAAEVYVYPAR
jgi:[ribosomal protein S5]-alanine N-acetyltransferase